MSMKYMQCPHDPSETPSDSPTSATFYSTVTLTLRPSISGWGCILMIYSSSSG